MPGVTPEGIHHPDGATDYRNLGAELKTFAEEVSTYIGEHAGQPGPPGPAAPQGVFENFLPANFRRLRGAIANARVAGLCRISVYGDSNTNGYMAGTPGISSDYRRGFAERARSILEGDFGPSRDGLIFTRIGGGGLGGVDPRFTLGAGWAEFFDGTLAGGWHSSQGPGGAGSIEGTGPTAGTLDITLENVDSFTMWAASFAGGPATVQMWIDNEPAVTANYAGAGSLPKTTVKSTAGVGTHTLHIKAASAGSLYVIAVEGSDSTKRGLRWTTVGLNGVTAAAWNKTISTSPWESAQLIWNPDVADPDLTVINMSINAHNGAMPQATYKAAMETLIAKAKSVGDVILIASAAGGNGAPATWPAYLQTQRELAAWYGCGLINMQARWGDYLVAADPPYLFWNDPDHPSHAGYWDIGQALADGIRLATGRSA